PTLVVIDPLGNYVGSLKGEGNGDRLDRVIGELVERHKAQGTLDRTPVQFFPENEKPHAGALLYPGKVLADAEVKRLFIADTGHNRIVVTDWKGKGQKVIG